jgi:hypothetical protein
VGRSRAAGEPSIENVTAVRTHRAANFRPANAFSAAFPFRRGRRATFSCASTGG